MPSDVCRVSIVVCTLNRAASLRQTLMSITSQRLGNVTCEIIVVDNGSNDETASVVEEIQAYSPFATTYLVEAQKGLSVSRNRGLAAASGEFVLFIDDDARACPEWVAAIVNSFDANRHIDAIGGPVLPDPPSVLPVWLPRRLRSHLSLLNYGNRPRKLQYPHVPIGTNMALRKEVFGCIGRFDDALGRHGDASHMTGEETDLFLRLERQGRKIHYVPKAIVHHRMHSQRLQPNWLYHQSYWIGRSTAVIEKKSLPTPHVYLNLARAIVLIIVDVVVWKLAALFNDRKLAFWAHCIWNNSIGYIHGVFNSKAPEDKKGGNP